jgi:F0F1-type ATP synthase membrane subunit b/b'
MLTDDEQLFKTTLEKLEGLKRSHLERIDAAEAQLNQEIHALLSTMQTEFENIRKQA